MSEAHLIAHQFIFYGILKWSIEQYLHFLALDESHLDDTFTESTVAQHLDDDAFLTCL